MLNARKAAAVVAAAAAVTAPAIITAAEPAHATPAIKQIAKTTAATKHARVTLTAYQGLAGRRTATSTVTSKNHIAHNAHQLTVNCDNGYEKTYQTTSKTLNVVVPAGRGCSVYSRVSVWINLNTWGASVQTKPLVLSRR